MKIFDDRIKKQETFLKELKLLLAEYDAELVIEDFGMDWSTDDKMVVQFNWDEHICDLTGDGSIPDLVIGTWENGKP